MAKIIEFPILETLEQQEARLEKELVEMHQIETYAQKSIREIYKALDAIALARDVLQSKKRESR